ncbi:hypothetical protein M3Y98_00835900 [Aphelenchoides besseyi]|nr:hypothetical protein M3Y98_00835900 [Aphelenchoides besseyi]KAI6195465.1 hypothetical protein M3Y96_01234200 [Aphelenchoides besseyi]
MVNDNRTKNGHKKNEKIVRGAPYKYTNTIYEAHKLSVYGAAFNPYLNDSEKGYWLATCGSRYVTIYRLYPKDKRMESMVQFQDPNKEEGYYAITWAIDEVVRRHVVVVGGAKGIIRVLDPLTKETCNTLRGHGESVNELRTSPINPLIVASASKDRTARLWNIRSSDCLAVFGGAYGHLDEVISLDFDLDQRFLLTTSMDHTVRVWDLRERTKTAERIDKSINGDDSVVSLPAEENHFPLAVSRDVHTNYVDCGRFLGEFIVSKSCENSIVLWKFGGFDYGAAGEGTLLRTETYVLHCAWMDLPHAETWFIKFDIHPKNKYIACGNENGEIHLWHLDSDYYPERDSDYMLINSECSFCVRQTVFSPNGEILIAVGENGNVSRFDAQP